VEFSKWQVFHLLAHFSESSGTNSFTREDLVTVRGHDFHLVRALLLHADFFHHPDLLF
jgi:hypothetical protein